MISQIVAFFGLLDLVNATLVQIYRYFLNATMLH